MKGKGKRLMESLILLRTRAYLLCDEVSTMSRVDDGMAKVGGKVVG